MIVVLNIQKFVHAHALLPKYKITQNSPLLLQAVAKLIKSNVSLAATILDSIIISTNLPRASGLIFENVNVIEILFKLSTHDDWADCFTPHFSETIENRRKSV